MRNRTSRGVIALAITALAAGVGAAVPAQAADDKTTVTFSLGGGGLAISAPESKDLGQFAASATTIGGALGDVTVTDQRGQAAATWTATAQSSDFKTGGGSAAETIPATNVTYTPGLTTGSAVTVPTAGLLGGVLPLPVIAATAVGNNNATWNPRLDILLPVNGAVAGDYTGTITHSVS